MSSDPTRNPAAAIARLRAALHAAVDMADAVIDTNTLGVTAGKVSGNVVSVQLPVEEWGALCSAVREVLNRG